MKFEQALQEMIKGHYVRLSDWLGYWWMPYVSTDPKTGEMPTDYTSFIKVFTRDGDVLDTPKLNRYKDRDDWEIVAEIGWSFDMALRFLKNGRRVTRSIWNTSNSLSLNDGEFLYDFDRDYPPVKHDLSSDDILATDWIIVNA
jgi:hypothetical protein